MKQKIRRLLCRLRGHKFNVGILDPQERCARCGALGATVGEERAYVPRDTGRATASYPGDLRGSAIYGESPIVYARRVIDEENAWLAFFANCRCYLKPIQHEAEAAEAVRELIAKTLGQ